MHEQEKIEVETLLEKNIPQIKKKKKKTNNETKRNNPQTKQKKTQNKAPSFIKIE